MNFLNNYESNAQNFFKKQELSNEEKHYWADIFEQAEANKYWEKGKEIGELVDEKQKAYGDAISVVSQVIKIFLEQYKNKDGTYSIPESLLDHLLLQIRIIDKQSRIFSNPSGDLMNENPYNDITGYGLLGINMVEKKGYNK